jgi:hypothetical protein
MHARFGLAAIALSLVLAFPASAEITKGTLFIRGADMS